MTDIIIVPGTDPLRLMGPLPEPGREKYETVINDPLVAARALHGSAMEIQRDEQNALNVAERNRETLRARPDMTNTRTERYIPPFEGGRLQGNVIEVTYEPTKAELDAAEEKVTKAKVRLERARGIVAARSDTVQQLGQVQLHVDDWISGIPAGAELKMHAPAIRVPDGATIATVRKRIEGLKEERLAIEDAPVPMDDQVAAVDALIGTMAARGAPAISGVSRGQPKISFPVTHAAISASGHTPKGEHILTMGQAVIPDVPALLAWLFRSELTAAIERELGLGGEDDGAMSEQDQKARIVELDAEILGAERVEERLVETAISQGQSLLRRVDPDPRAVLGLADHPVPRRAAAA